MSLATRCTHCGTIFKVVQDQLKVSEGWVRCGRCNEVFNALPGLFDLDRDPPPQRPASAPPRPPEPGAAFTPPPPEPVADAQESTWPSTSPAPQIEQDDFALDENPTHAPLDDLLSAPDFELDTAVAMPGQPEPPPPAFEAYAPTPPPAPFYPRQPEAPSPPEFLPSNLPVTDESDALDSRYLMPSDTERPQRRRRRRGPDFADAEFPTDALGEIHDEWASDFGPSSTPYIDEPPPVPVASPAAAKSSPEATPPDSPAEEELSLAPTNEAFVPEQSLKPPSQRKGRPGTRGRDPAAKTPEFLRRAQRRAFWRHPATRTVLSLISLALVAALALQAAHQFRNTLAAHYPEARPYLAQWCEAMACKIEPPLRIDSLQVESATLVRTNSEGPDTYRLVVVVQNRAPIGLAWPDVDLTLTDTNGAVVARRAFSPRDAQWLNSADTQADPGVAPGPLPTAAPANSSTTLQWRLHAPNLKLAGYTAELFYP